MFRIAIYRKHPSIIIAGVMLLCFTGKLWAQDSLPLPRNIAKAYAAGTRSADGKPGNHYWQNSAIYDIKVTFHPATLLVEGTEEISYTNNSPDTLKEIWIKLYPNYYKKGAARDEPVRPEDLGDGVHIQQLSINGRLADSGQMHIAGTNMTVQTTPLLPGGHIRCAISFSYTLNKTSHQRTGEVAEGSYFIAYFFPRIAVYDDIDGWNRIPYTGTQEFYNDFCTFKVAVTVPGNYVVWATGNLVNAEAVLHDRYIRRLRSAEQQDSVITIIDSTDIRQGNITLNNTVNTWRFEADSVTDFVFATSDHYMWQSSSLVVDPATGRRTRVDAAFDPRHSDYFKVIGYARKTVEAMSYVFPAWPFPYSHETVYDGLDQMEYPMMVNDNPLTNRAAEIMLTTHEIFHTMFPFYMGINETKYAWMDEGWATIGEWLISPLIDSSITDQYGLQSYAVSAGTEADLPVITLSSQQKGISYYLNSYPKPALGYLYIKDMLGDSLFTRALHYYITQWHGRHPSPYDFFHCMNTGSGKDLNWFWKRWFLEKGYPDLAIEKVHSRRNLFDITIRRKGSKPVPVNLFFRYADSSSQKMHRDISCWEKGNKKLHLRFRADRPVKTITLGDTYDADVNPKNNLYKVR